MGGRKAQSVLLELRRQSPTENWGFSLVGGADQNSPLIVTRVSYGSPVQKTLERGDIITKIGNYDGRDVRHQDAQNLFRNAGTNIRVVVQRDINKNAPGSRTSSRNFNSPLSVSPHLSPRPGPGSAGSSLYSPAGAPVLQPYLPTTFPSVDSEGYFKEIPDVRNYNNYHRDDEQDMHVVNQPYRTTPLVLPGAKVKRDSGPTECYLRHHPNPAVRAPPHHLDHDFMMKQKVADAVIQRVTTDDPNKQVVHKQFNSPIGLYSDANIVDTLQKQTGTNNARTNGVAYHRPIGPKKVTFDPAKSETYKAVQEEQELEGSHEAPVPISRVYTPNKIIPGKKPLPNTPAPAVFQHAHHVNSLGESPDTIHQSHTFKRLMWNVLAESDF